MGKTIFMRFPGGRSKAMTFSYDDSVYQDLRLKGIFDKYHLKCTFNINSGWMHPEEQERVEYKGKLKFSEMADFTENHEIAVHTSHHPRLEILKPINLLDEILEDRREIERRFGTDARGMAYPFGGVSDAVINAARTAGIVYSRHVDSTHNFALPQNWMMLKPTCHHADPRLMELADKFVNQNPRWEEVWMFYVWGHSYEFDNDQNWDVIEKFAQYISRHDDVWYATNIQIYDYVKAYEALRLSALAERVYNPTASKVWLCCSGETISIGPGEERKL